jgi:hypothetical protein
MQATTDTDHKARAGDAFPTLELVATSGQLVTIPDPAGGLRPPSAPALRRLSDLQPSPTLGRHSP